MTRRGGQVDFEIEHGEHLLESDPETTWGWGTPAGRFRVAARIAWFQRVLGLRPMQRVLECGCGTGVFTSQLARFPIDLTAVDISPDLLERARARTECRSVAFARTNLENPVELEDASFDAVCGVSVLHHLDTKAALPALFRKVR
ncbi:MAG TPA: class I SAM-dependent methyltransferase, partial [Vicinamibacterales bacterium]|nr:class I SAM-dependent methyltransferase [Vicinamibacterales bacterium]